MAKQTKADLLDEVAVLKEELEDADISACTARANAREAVGTLGVAIARAETVIEIVGTHVTSLEDGLATIRAEQRRVASLLMPPPRQSQGGGGDDGD